jgi:DNA-binding NarL/FixJ family response regulator
VFPPDKEQQMTTAPPVRVVIADDHQLFAETLGLTLDVDDRVELVGTAHNGKEALRLALDLLPDVVLMDLEMPVLDGIAATQAVRRSLPECQVVMLTASPVPEDALRARKAGAAGYLTKGCSTRDVIDAVLEVVNPNRGREVTADERGVRAPRAAGRSHSLLQSRSFSPHCV